MNHKKSGPIDRRTVLKTAGATGLMLATGAYALTARKRSAVVGVGARACMYTGAITEKFRDDKKIVAICDKNAGLAALADRTISATGASAQRACLMAKVVQASGSRQCHTPATA